MHALNGDKIFSTGQVAKICQCATRTVAKWCDSGMLQTFRLPLQVGRKRLDPGDRRITREALTAFLQSRGLPLPAILGGTPCLLLVGCAFPAWLPALPGVEVQTAADAFEAGRLAGRTPPAAAVIDLSNLGRSASLMVAAGLLAGHPRPLLAALTSEDEADREELEAAGFSRVFCRPFHPADLAAWATKHLAM